MNNANLSAAAIVALDIPTVDDDVNFEPSNDNVSRDHKRAVIDRFVNELARVTHNNTIAARGGSRFEDADDDDRRSSILSAYLALQVAPAAGFAYAKENNIDASELVAAFPNLAPAFAA